MESTELKIKHDAKKKALAIYKKIYDHLYSINLELLEIPQEYKHNVFGDNGTFKTIYNEIKDVLDKLTQVKQENKITDDDIQMEEFTEPVDPKEYGMNDEFVIGGDEMEEVGEF